ncbi:zinc finger and SCAN domain-containing protein 30-like [Phyllostomus hastatus]|uniref:zinc finger and SCAN domain-containing protein 30-like n=1 Tax=Phyllostomus hastatus TaxID=9423 RepID=UPI001E67F116|nr:zinc finger and SCAN domain-containing protein 30-like [Phyllostomus hastatus]
MLEELEKELDGPAEQDTAHSQGMMEKEMASSGALKSLSIQLQPLENQCQCKSETQEPQASHERDTVASEGLVTKAAVVRGVVNLAGRLVSKGCGIITE